jgi:hypothetical protein
MTANSGEKKERRFFCIQETPGAMAALVASYSSVLARAVISTWLSFGARLAWPLVRHAMRVSSVYTLSCPDRATPSA